MKLRLLLFLAPVIILIVILSGIIFKINEDMLLNSLKNQEIERADAFTGDISKEYTYINSILKYVSEQQIVQQLFTETSESERLKDEEALKKRLSKLLQHQPTFTELMLLTTTGKALIQIERFNQKIITANENQGIEPLGSQAFENALKIESGQVYVESVQPVATEKSPSVSATHFLYFFVSVMDRDGNRIGLLRLTYDASPFLIKLKKIGAATGSQIILLNLNGYFLKPHTETGDPGVNVNQKANMHYQTDYEELAQKLEKETARQFELNGKLYTVINFCDLTHCDTQNVSNTLQLDLIAAGMPWTIVSELDLNKALASSNTNASWYWVYGMIAVLGALTILSGIAGWRLLNVNASLQSARKDVMGKDKLFSTFIDSNPSLIFAKDDKGKYVIANKTYADFLNETPASLIGKSDFDLDSVDITKISKFITQEQLVLHTGKVTLSEETWQNQKQAKKNFVVTRFPIDVELNGHHKREMIGVIAIDVTDRDEARSEMAQKEAMFRTLINSSPNAIIIVDKNGHINFANKVTTTIFKWEHDELLDKSVDELMPDEFIKHHLEVHQKFTASNGNDNHKLEVMVKALTKYEDSLDVEVTLTPIKIDAELMTMAIVRDVTGKLKMESHIRQSQKMEAIGHLTGGVAHDFNNLLGVIIGNLDLLNEYYHDDEKAQRRINNALKASLSGAELTKRLLAFARKQTLNPQVVDVGTALEEMVPILDRSLKGDIELKVHIPKHLSKVFIDISEFENVVLNMAINARDAMPKGGMLTIEVEEIEIDEDFVNNNDHENLSLGKYIHISLSDNGSGMSDEVIKHIFEPFYTTKEKGKGTGLGLAMAHGFVKQSKGLLRVYSEENIGTTFHIYLPTADKTDSVNPPSQTEEPDILQGGNETILVVDDEPDLAEIASAYLDTLGYKTIIAQSGEVALELLAEHSDISLVLTDIIMSGGMDGVELHRHIHEAYPHIKVVYASGFSADVLTNKRGHEIRADLVQKPYRKNNLALIIRKNLDGLMDSQGAKS